MTSGSLIVFISADDMRVEDLSAMPNVRRLIANQGTTFSTSYAPYPLCCPARAAWVTGQYSHNNGVMGNASSTAPEGGYAALDASSTVATWLRSAGYQTAFVGKYLNGYGALKPVTVPVGWQEVARGGWWRRLLHHETSRKGKHRRRASRRGTYSGIYQVDLYDSLATDLIGQAGAERCAVVFAGVPVRAACGAHP